MRKKQIVFLLASIVVSALIFSSTTEAASPKKASDNTLKPYANTTKDGKIKQLQQLLADTGFYPGEIAGTLNLETRDAIIRAQKTFKLNQTGQYDQKLVNILLQESRRKPTTYRKKLSMQATAYTAQDPGCGNLTKREHRLRKGLVAVDPKVIKLGTRLYIEGYGYAIADDIGSAIKGLRIDLAFENRSAAFQFGRKNVAVYVLD